MSTSTFARRVSQRVSAVTLAGVLMAGAAVGLSDIGRAGATPARVNVSATSASVTSAATARRVRAFNYGWAQRGWPYVWGGDSRSEGGFDCSGLTYRSYRVAGISLPRTAGAQRSSSKTYHVSRWKAKRGDLAFVGSGHVEFVYDFNRGRTKMRTYGAHRRGVPAQLTGWHGVWHVEHVRGAG